MRTFFFGLDDLHFPQLHACMYTLCRPNLKRGLILGHADISSDKWFLPKRSSLQVVFTIPPSRGIQHCLRGPPDQVHVPGHLIFCFNGMQRPSVSENLTNWVFSTKELHMFLEIHSLFWGDRWTKEVNGTQVHCSESSSIWWVFFVERVDLMGIFESSLLCVFLLGVFHSKEGWQLASFEILIKQSFDHVFRADLIECRRNWFNWWAGCRLKFYSILSIEIQTYQPRAALCTSPDLWAEMRVNTLLLNCSVCDFSSPCPIGITVGKSPLVFLVSTLVRMGGESSVNDPWWPILIHGDSYQVGFQVYSMRIFQDIPGCEW